MAGRIIKQSFQGKAFNRQVFLEGLALLLLGLAFIYLVFSGRCLDFVVPRLKPYLLGAGAVLLILGSVHLTRLQVPAYGVRTHSAWLLLGAAILFFCLQPAGLSSSHQADGFAAELPGAAANLDAKIKGQNRSGRDGRLRLDPAVNATASDQTASSLQPSNAGDIPPELQAFLEEQKTHPNKTNPYVTDPADQTVPAKTSLGEGKRKAGRPGSEPGTYISTALTGQEQTLHGFDSEEQHVEISDQEFYAWLCEIFLNPDDFFDYTLTLNAQVFINEKVSQGQTFLASRLLMTCCTADLVPTGILAMLPDGSLPRQDDWLRLTGRLTEVSFEGRTVPALAVSKADPGQVPAERYVYPYPR